jgi:hypothetical protein
MITELKTYQIKCDGKYCSGKTITVMDTNMPGLPRGWETRQVYNCGLTGYTRHDLLCEYCVSCEKPNQG